jgi:hypothetical protein
MGQRTNASAANSKPINPEDAATSLCAAPVKVAGEFFVVVGTEVGMLDGTTASVLLTPVAAGTFAVVAMIVLVLVLVLAPELAGELKSAAAALYASSVLFEPAFSLMTMDIPFWQWPVWPQ